MAVRRAVASILLGLVACTVPSAAQSNGSSLRGAVMNQTVETSNTSLPVLKNGLPMSDADRASQPLYHCPPHVGCFGSCRDEPFGGRTRETECNPAKQACGPVYCASGWCYGWC
ncbi:unnamed protein product [Polarella glacialis]|uniref:Secreted protein n=1 Tax=Polarella glacialis TaxID=89957 RepID=A0A813EU09_POLGL|nr:unnamed protein product [Polarella glacialis]